MTALESKINDMINEWAGGGWLDELSHIQVCVIANQITKLAIEHGETETGNTRELLADAYRELSGKTEHASDCATSNSPAMIPGKCDCNT